MSVNLSDFLSTTYVGATGPSGPQGPSSGTITVVASGVIPSAGLPVALNADGTAILPLITNLGTVKWSGNTTPAMIANKTELFTYHIHHPATNHYIVLGEKTASYG